METFIVIDWLARKVISDNVVYDETKAKALAFEQIQKYHSIQTAVVEVIKLKN